MNLQTDTTTCFKSENQLNQLNYPVNSLNLVDNKVALPLHIQNLEKALNLNTFLKQVHSFIDDKRDDKLNLSLSKQQSKDVKSSIYSFNKTGKNKNWLKNILIDNSDESDDDLDKEVDELLKIRKNFKRTTHKQANQFNSNLSSNLLSLNDSIPLSSLFKNERQCKSTIKKRPTTSKKKVVKGGDLNNSNHKLDDKFNERFDERLKDEFIEKSHQMTCYFEASLNHSKISSNKNDNDLIETSCLDSKLDDYKYECSLADDILQSESNMNDFVNSFLTNMNDQIVYSHQLPDEIFETEEEMSNGFQSYDLNKLIDEPMVECVKEHQQANQLLQTANQLVDIKIKQELHENIPCLVNEQPIKLTEPSIKLIEPISVNNKLITEIIVKPSDQATDSINSTVNDSNVITTLNASTIPDYSTIATTAIKTIDSSDVIKLSKIIVKKKEKLSNKGLLELEPEQIQQKRRKLWSTIVKKEIPKAYKMRLINRKEVLNNCKKLAACCQKERKNVIVPKLNRERSKKSNKEMATYKRNEETVIRQLLPNIPKLEMSNNTKPIIIGESVQEMKLSSLL